MPTRTRMLAHGFERAPERAERAGRPSLVSSRRLAPSRIQRDRLREVQHGLRPVRLAPCGDVLSAPGVSVLNRSEKRVSNQSTTPCTITGPPASVSSTTERCVSPVAPSPAPAATLASTSSPRTPSVRACQNHLPPR